MVANAYQRDWELGLKGVTIYQYGSKSRKCSISDSARRHITMITRPDVIRTSAKCDA